MGRDNCALLRETTLHKAIEVTMRIKCLLIITAALIMLFLIASLAYSVMPWFA
jgi:hypothetical protein